MVNIGFAAIARLPAFDATEVVTSKDALPNPAPLPIDCSRQAYLVFVRVAVDLAPCRAVIETSALDPVRSTLHKKVFWFAQANNYDLTYLTTWLLSSTI